MSDRKEMIAKIKQLPGLLEKAVEGLDDGKLDTPYGEGKWTVRQVVHHLADSHMNAFIRFKLTVTENKPTLKPYNQDDWATTIEAKTAPIEPSLGILKGVHERWVMLMELLPESAWSRVAYHPEHGDLTLTDILNTYSRHGENHVSQIVKLSVAEGWKVSYSTLPGCL